MSKHKLFSVKITSLQAKITYLKRRSQQAIITPQNNSNSSTLINNDNKKIARARLIYQGWFSETRKILETFSKDQHEISLFRAIYYHRRIENHLVKIGSSQAEIHQKKSEFLLKISQSLETLINEKKAEFEQGINSSKAYFDESSTFTLADINLYKEKSHRLNILYKKHSLVGKNLNELKNAVEDFITFLDQKKSELEEEDSRVIDQSINQMICICDERLHFSCFDFLKSIKKYTNKNHTNPAFIALIKRHKRLLTMAHTNPDHAHEIYQLINDFMKELLKTSGDAAGNKQQLKIYHALIRKFNQLNSHNQFYLARKQPGQSDLLTKDNPDISSEEGSSRQNEIKASQAPSRDGNRVIHYLNSYENLKADKLRGAFPTIIKYIMHAEKCILIQGWEINLHIDYLCPDLLTLEEHKNSANTLGKILVQKAINNPNLVIVIKVWAQLWDRSMSYHHDAIEYLNNIALAKGIAEGLKGLPNLQFRAINHRYYFNSHHAKSVIVDAKLKMTSGVKKRRLVGISGGLDLSLDRIDDSCHTRYKESNIFGWRDNHQLVIGPVVADMLNDFASSWQNARNGNWGMWDKWTKDAESYRCFERFCHQISNTGLLDYSEVKIDKVWHSQFLRSTTAVSHASFWKDDKSFENSIAKGYKEAISEAKHVIELESQYLIGGPGLHRRAKLAAYNPIPQALVDKIYERHSKNKTFHVFITLPMLPNANSKPGKLEMDSIRYLQWRTIKWIKHQVEEKTHKPWWTYLSFNFLAQWYGPKADSELPPNPTRNQLVTHSQRSPIYVHSKFLIIDNKLMICGSANANERSMRGKGGDSEIAIIHRPEPNNKIVCAKFIHAIRRKNYEATLGTEFVETHPNCIENPEKYALERRQLALQNFKHFMENKKALSATPGASQLLTWPWKYKNQTGHVGRYQKKYQNLVDTPQELSGQDCYRWHPEKGSRIVTVLNKLDLRLAY